MFIKEPWFWRGFQSAVFYYVSCAPCTKVAYQRKQKKELRKAEAEKARAEAEDGPSMSYPSHPLPSGTNPYWEEEMRLGPGPPPKRRRSPPKKRRKEEERRLMEMQAVGGSVDSTNASKGASSDTMHGSLEYPPEAVTRDSEEGWNRRRYQREDEVLWGLEETMSQSTETSNVSRSRSRTSCYYYRNPAVNDMHPPVVSTPPASRSEVQWMLQPPPRAKVMDGKERANRSRSESRTSNASRGSSVRKGGEHGLGRQLSERLMETKLRQGDHPLPTALSSRSLSRSRGSSNQSRGSNTAMTKPLFLAPPNGQRHDRDTGGEKAADVVQRSKSQQKNTTNTPAPPITIDSGPTNAASRPPLSTIPSTSLVTKQTSPADTATAAAQTLVATETPTPATQQRPHSTGSAFLSPSNNSITDPNKHLITRTSTSSLHVSTGLDPQSHWKAEDSHRKKQNNRNASTSSFLVLQDLDPNPQLRFKESQTKLKA